jgi:hypothetical protein
MNMKRLSLSLLALPLFLSCDNGVISGDTYADITVRVTPYRGSFDALVIDIRKGGVHGDLRASYDLLDPDQIQYNIPMTPVGEWTVVASYFNCTRKVKLDSSGKPIVKDGDTLKVIDKSWGHRLAVAQAEITVAYDAQCDCNVVQGDDVDLRLLD